MTDLFVPAPQSSLWSFYIKYFQPCNAGWEERENEEHVAQSGQSWALWYKAVGNCPINPSLCCFIYILAHRYYLFIMSDALSINKDKSHIDSFECQAGTKSFMTGPWRAYPPSQFMTCEVFYFLSAVLALIHIFVNVCIRRSTSYSFTGLMWCSAGK